MPGHVTQTHSPRVGSYVSQVFMTRHYFLVCVFCFGFISFSLITKLLSLYIFKPVIFCLTQSGIIIFAKLILFICSHITSSYMYFFI